jgi:hypothetical protein
LRFGVIFDARLTVNFFARNDDVRRDASRARRADKRY